MLLFSDTMSDTPAVEMILFMLELMAVISWTLSDNKCDIQTDNETAVVNCQRLGLRSIPKHLPVHTVQLSLRQN